ncbi:MAG: hypothetical protein KatS3mg105_3393 [Gemmatales bacterium]|nr:MAG: hypothetical protein KatS3mg105_3393 [Gemmatales bacterium]
MPPPRPEPLPLRRSRHCTSYSSTARQDAGRRLLQRLVRLPKCLVAGLSRLRLLQRPHCHRGPFLGSEPRRSLFPLLIVVVKVAGKAEAKCLTIQSIDAQHCLAANSDVNGFWLLRRVELEGALERAPNRIDKLDLVAREGDSRPLGQLVGRDRLPLELDRGYVPSTLQRLHILGPVVGDSATGKAHQRDKKHGRRIQTYETDPPGC